MFWGDSSHYFRPFREILGVAVLWVIFHVDNARLICPFKRLIISVRVTSRYFYANSYGLYGGAVVHVSSSIPTPLIQINIKSNCTVQTRITMLKVNALECMYDK